ncbi:hypothetical protein MKY92_16450 [Paenibacillus sp. FSL R5-0623]|uniref:hypothetical protein n=1 Tax=Paenibacillus sp. FSL R5-0623 TaxID=2921651 RepID=UPI0030D90AF9
MEVYNTEEDAAGLYITGLVELFKYIRSNMRIGEDLELYCCWAHGQERFLDAPNKELDLVIELA